MKITWLGHACFSIEHRGWTVVIDPYNSDYTAGYPPLKVRADALLVSHEHYGHNFREGVVLSGRPQSECPFEITALEVDHDSVGGIMRGTCLVHVLEVDGLKVAHMSDLGTKLTGADQSRLFGADALMVTAGSCRGLPSQEVWRLTEELFPKVIIPMHYRFGNHGARRLEHIENLVNCYESPDLAKFYEGNTITIDESIEPQIAILKYIS